MDYSKFYESRPLDTLRDSRMITCGIPLPVMKLLYNTWTGAANHSPRPAPRPYRAPRQVRPPCGVRLR
eukprot:5887711-Pyramimonas_sp.AAC.1